VSGRAPRFVLPPGGTGIDGAWLAGTVALYTATGELRYHDEKPIVHPEWGCTRSRSERSQAGPIALVTIYLVSVAMLARRSAGAWASTVAVHVLVAIFAGLALGDVYAGLRMANGTHCYAIEFCGYCPVPLTWYQQGIAFLVPALAGAAAAPLVGWIARLPRRRSTGHTTSIEEPSARHRR
jgi:hypothetical protein